MATVDRQGGGLHPGEETSRERLRRTEALLTAIVETSAAAIFVKDAEGRYTLVNRWCERLWARDRSQILGRTDDELFPPEVAERLRANDREVLESGEPHQFEETTEFADGVHVFLTSKVPLFGPDGRAEALCGVATDVTRLKRAEEALRQADRRKDEYLAVLSHELRNPLAPIRTGLALLREEGLASPRAARAQQMMERQVVHLSRLVDDLLDVSRISSGRLLVHRRPLDLARLVRETVEDHGDALEGRDLDLRLPDEPVAVHGDATRLAQALGNLLHNAGKFTDPGDRVRVSLAADRDAGEARLSVEDSGIGIEPGQIPALFEPFRGGSSDPARGRDGMGLGLTLVKRLVELHGGGVEAASDGPGRGARFTVRLPLSNGEAATTTEEGPMDEISAAAPRRILVIEDQADAAESLSLLLGIKGYQVEVADDGASALARAREFLPEVVLCDIGLPGELDGYALARAFRADPRLAGAHLIALTGYGREEDRRRSREAGFEHHLIKPVDTEALVGLLLRLG